MHMFWLKGGKTVKTVNNDHLSRNLDSKNLALGFLSR